MSNRRSGGGGGSDTENGKNKKDKNLWYNIWALWGCDGIFIPIAIAAFVMAIIALCRHPSCDCEPTGNYTVKEYFNLGITDSVGTSLGGDVNSVFVVYAFGEGRYTVEWNAFSFVGNGDIAQFTLVGSPIDTGGVKWTSMITTQGPVNSGVVPLIPTLVSYNSGSGTPIVMFQPTSQLVTGNLWANAAAYSVEAGMITIDVNMNES